ncbi:SusC/RagA family TonB-linked outer membrane protein [Phaeodactylibacter luteus]|uniref:TonB-dependent receptor n=1 Tax=Phaeodactylibacter luteus TaxID=1564516 RepID=A0A5C6RII7_9BACT|nr:TonB-dependent receptor [Phaeodactylibacter luteus]TXB61480.1 TonB-dependent receptor [Phaeodactylibacter luteus]
MKNLLRWAVALAGVLCVAQASWAQGKVQGVATDENGEPLIGATVLLVGSSRGTATDFDGNYLLENVPSGEQQIRASYTGYADLTKTITVADGETITLDFTLGEDVEVLDEVVVIGYGSVRKEDATGVVAKVTTKDFNRGAIVSPEQLITGKVAGVQIAPGDGSPGGGSAIRIRGATSLNASNEPLFVVDGMPLDNEGTAGGRNPLNFINPSDIESFTVLKDASATAIYGSRGANGVIIITTKKGEAGSRPRVNYDGYYTVNELRGEPAMLDAGAFRDLVTFHAPSRLSQLGNANTNWFDETLRTAQGQSHNLSVSGGGQDYGYRISAGFQELEGIIRSSETERISYALNYNHKLLDGNLLINTNLRGARTQDVFDPGIGAAWELDPTQPVLDPANTAFGGYFEYGNPLAPRNPVSAIEQRQDLGQSFRNIGNMDMELKLDNLLEGLSLKGNVGFDINQGERTTFEPTTFVNTQVANYNGRVRVENFTRTNYLMDAYLKYQRSLNERNRLDLTVGYSYQDFNEEYPIFEGQNLPTDQFGANRPDIAEDVFPFNTSFENRLISFWGRAIYSFDDRYVLTATLRRDGSTRFGPENRWGLFPSAALAWRVLEENWAEGLNDLFSDLKFRVSYGVTGNQEIGDYRYLSQYAISDQRARYQIGYNADGTPIFINTARPDAYDAGLKWEETTSFNAGLEFGFGNGRISGSLEYYVQNTNDLLFDVNVAAGTNLSDRVLTNVGELQNSGVELSLTGTVVNTPELSWSLSGNIAYNRTEVLEISNIAGSGGILRGGISGGVGNNIQILRVGGEIDAFYVYEHILDENGNPVNDVADQPMYVDQNEDGVINEADRRLYQSPAPDIIYGLTSNLQFKGFDLAMTLRGAVGNYVYNNNASNRGFYNRITGLPGFMNNVHESALVTGFRNPQYFSDYYVEDASFMRLDNITLGYTFLPKRGVSSLRLYVTGQNLLVFTRYSGLDPEVGIGGIDNAPYPRPMGFIFGASLGL